MSDDDKREIVHIKIGTPEWEPTDADMRRVTEMFEEALDGDDSALVITREGIEVSLERVEEGETMRLFVVTMNRVDAKATSTTSTNTVDSDLDALVNSPWTQTLQ